MPARAVAAVAASLFLLTGVVGTPAGPPPAFAEDTPDATVGDEEVPLAVERLGPRPDRDGNGGLRSRPRRRSRCCGRGQG